MRGLGWGRTSSPELIPDIDIYSFIPPRLKCLYLSECQRALGANGMYVFYLGLSSCGVTRRPRPYHILQEVCSFGAEEHGACLEHNTTNLLRMYTSRRPSSTVDALLFSVDDDLQSLVFPPSITWTTGSWFPAQSRSPQPRARVCLAKVVRVLYFGSIVDCHRRRHRRVGGNSRSTALI
ncbi:hypothetical protein N657DRAFT_335573 [Parathielavia appendiculata]|uniref:Uncharacterized protein n=1 Tax=Parathielavia appendiculata TaxID=2587402 RepID=A0AAN6U1Y0_9PEZI|nr:hypothetical protein N657DRAFT_335573 [Parathielavia appendiculata]